MRAMGGLGGVVALVGCTMANPAYDGGGGTQGSATDGIASTSSSTGGAEGEPGTASGGAEGSGLATAGATGHGTAASTTDIGGADETSDGTGDQGPPQIGPFGPPMPLPMPINDPLAEDDDPTLTGDMLELYFASRRGGGMGNDDIWVARRESVADEWGPPEPVHALNSNARENTPEITLDGRTMLFASTRANQDDENVYVSTRRDRASEWSPPELVAALSSPDRDVCPFPTEDGLHVYMCAGLTGDTQLVRFDRGGPDDAWMGPFGVNVNTPGFDCGPWLDESGQWLSWMTNRPGGAGGNDLWLARRGSNDLEFVDEAPIEGVNSPFDDDDPWISPDGGTIFFASTRSVIPTGVPHDLYVAYRVE